MFAVITQPVAQPGNALVVRLCNRTILELSGCVTEWRWSCLVAQPGSAGVVRLRNRVTLQLSGCATDVFPSKLNRSAFLVNSVAAIEFPSDRIYCVTGFSLSGL